MTPDPPAQKPAVLIELDRVRFAVDVAGQILSRPTGLEQPLLEPAALGGVHQHGVVVYPGPQHRGDLAVPEHFFEHGTVQRDQCQPVRGMLHQLQPPVAAHGVHKVDQQRLGHRIPGEAHQRVDDLFSVMTRGARVPQRQGGDPVGVDVFGGALKLREGRNRGARRAGRWMVDL
jgi:hypothetical protein